jgi:DNA polymerase V
LFTITELPFIPLELTLTPASNDTRQICKLVGESIGRIWQNGLQVKKARILLLDLCRPEDAPMDLFSASCRVENPLTKALDQLEGRFGKETVMIGRLARRSGPDWFMTTGNRFPNYTTRWQDIPAVP